MYEINQNTALKLETTSDCHMPTLILNLLMGCYQQSKNLSCFRACWKL